MHRWGLAPILISILAVAPRAHADAPSGAADGATAEPPAAQGDAASSSPASAETSAPATAEQPKPATGAPPRPWRFTGTTGLSLPRPLNLEVIARFRRKDDPRWDLFAVGLGVEYLPKGLVQFDKPTVSWLTVGADGRWFPWRFVYIGARLGYQFVRTDSEKFGSEVDYVTSAFLFAPKAGVLYNFDSGLTLGGELGVGIPIGFQTSLESDGTEDSNARKVTKTFGMYTMPFASLRVGYTL